MAGLSIFTAGMPGQVQVNEAAANSELTIVWRDGLAGGEPVELYPIDFAAVIAISTRTSVRKTLDDYLGQRKA
jgi:hypothetical protein